MIKLSDSEKKVLFKIKKFLGVNRKKHYEFWFVYVGLEAVNWAGGHELSLRDQFRNDYSLFPDRKLVRNFDSKGVRCGS